jgi:vancomycin resistance protein YoaR
MSTVRRREPPRRRRGLRLTRSGWIAIGVAGVLLVLLLVALGVRATHSGKALPGTHVAGLDVSGESATAIARHLRPVLRADRPMILRADGRDLEVVPATAGYAVQLDATAEDAVQAGRSGFLGGLPATLGGLVTDRRVDVQATFDDRKMAKAVAGVAKKLDERPYPGALRIDADTGAVDTKASKPGRTVNQDVLAARIERTLRQGSRGPVTVPLDSVPAVSSDKLRSVAQDAERYLEKPLTLTVPGGDPIEISTEQLADVLALEGRDGGKSARLGVRDAGLAAVLDQVAEEVDREAKSAKISAPQRGEASLTEKGDVTWTPKPADVEVTPGKTGRAVDRDALATAIRSAVRKGTHTVKVPVKTTEPAITTAAAKKVDEEIGTFTTPYVAGQPRVQNIQQMARTVDGTVIAPGEQFSLNGIVGERTKEKGYVAAPFIAGNRIEPSVGGGVSQFSTTMYNAAYFAGLQIDSHQPHSLYIDRYPPGRESTLNFPDIDLTWTNDTDAPVLVRTAYDDDGVTVTLYGSNGKRKVTATAGKQEPVDGGDFEITVTRTVRYADGRVVRQPFTTRYENEDTSPQE